MKKVLVVVVPLAALVALAIGVAARPAASAGAGDPRIAVLQKQVKVLQAQVKDLRSQLSLNYEGDTCIAAQAADLVEGTWGVVDQVAQAAQQKTYFGTLTQVNDFGNCEDLGRPSVSRPPIAVPPSITPLTTLIAWLHE